MYLPSDWQTEIRSPPLNKHLPGDDMAHLIQLRQEGLTHLPLVLHTAPGPATNILLPELMTKTQQALQTSARNVLPQDWATEAPTPPPYEYFPSLTPNPIMGLGKFVVARIYQMRAAKRYLAARPYWFDENSNPSFPRCGTNPESFQQAIGKCSASTRVRDLLLKEILSLRHDTLLLTELHLKRKPASHQP